jgi:hypothetical protein
MRDSAYFARYAGCPEWCDLFLRASRSLALEGWYFEPGRCRWCRRAGLLTRIELYPLGRVFDAELCLGCHSLRVSFCDRAPDDLDWMQFKEEVKEQLHCVECASEEQWDSNNSAVIAFRRAVMEAERAEYVGWNPVRQRLTLVSNEPPPSAGKDS